MNRQPQYAWCCNVIRQFPGISPRAQESVWHKLAGPWSRHTFCGQLTRWMAPRKWLRTTCHLDRPALATAIDVKPAGLFCEKCQSLSLHQLVPPGWPKFREAHDAAVAGDWWEDRGDDRAELCRAIADPDWRPALDDTAAAFGPWGHLSVEGPSHCWARFDPPWPPMLGRDPGFHITYRALCRQNFRMLTFNIHWEFDNPREPCRDCLRRSPKIHRPAATRSDYAPYHDRAITPPPWKD